MLYTRITLAVKIDQEGFFSREFHIKLELEFCLKKTILWARSLNSSLNFLYTVILKNLHINWVVKLNIYLCDTSNRMGRLESIVYSMWKFKLSSVLVLWQLCSGCCHRTRHHPCACLTVCVCLCIVRRLVRRAPTDDSVATRAHQFTGRIRAIQTSTCLWSPSSREECVRASKVCCVFVNVSASVCVSVCLVFKWVNEWECVNSLIRVHG